MVSTTILGWFPHLDDYSQLITWMVSTTIHGWFQQLCLDGFNNYTWMVSSSGWLQPAVYLDSFNNFTWMVSTTVLGWFPHLDDYSQLITWMVSTTIIGWLQQMDTLDGYPYCKARTPDRVSTAAVNLSCSQLHAAQLTRWSADQLLHTPNRYPIIILSKLS